MIGLGSTSTTQAAPRGDLDRDRRALPGLTGAIIPTVPFTAGNVLWQMIKATYQEFEEVSRQAMTPLENDTWTAEAALTGLQAIRNILEPRPKRDTISTVNYLENLKRDKRFLSWIMIGLALRGTLKTVPSHELLPNPEARTKREAPRIGPSVSRMINLLQQPMFENRTLISPITTAAPIITDSTKVTPRPEVIVIQGKHYLAPAAEIVVIMALVLVAVAVYLITLQKIQKQMHLEGEPMNLVDGNNEDGLLRQHPPPSYDETLGKDLSDAPAFVQIP